MALIEYFSAEKLLKRNGIRSIQSKYVKDANAAVKFAGKDSIVLKAVSGKALHKSKSGLVVAGLNSDADIVKAFRQIERNAAKYKPYKIIAQKMVKGGIEIIVGGSEDAQFGKMILLGLGGIYVEAFKDFALRVCPITMQDAHDMVNQLRSKRVIAPDQKSEKMIAELILKVSKMYKNSDMSELDLNPVILHDGTYDAVDIRMIK